MSCFSATRIWRCRAAALGVRASVYQSLAVRLAQPKGGIYTHALRTSRRLDYTLGSVGRCFLNGFRKRGFRRLRRSGTMAAWYYPF